MFTGSRPQDYTTSVLGNATLEWIRHVLRGGATHPPFYAWVGPHAPHLPSTPAPWYAEHPIGLLQAPRSAWSKSYNYSAKDHHPLVASQPVLDEKDAASIDDEYARRMRSLLSVDDFVLNLYELLEAAGEWNQTYVIFTSDHVSSSRYFIFCCELYR